METSRRCNKNIQKLINNDLNWHQNNNLKLSASVKQGRIPELKYFTTEYNNQKIKEHKIDIENIMLMNEGYNIEDGMTEEGIMFKRIGQSTK